MEMILHGQRIATNGDVRLMPTPEQWDLVAQLKGRRPTRKQPPHRQPVLSHLPDGLPLEVAAEPGGVRVSVNLDKPLPEKLAGRAGFNLEFLPSIYVGKSYAMDGSVVRDDAAQPAGPDAEGAPAPDDPKKLPYQEEWDKDKGYTQPLPFASGKSVTLAADDPQYRIKITSENGPVSMYDGRNRAQNGWFVLRTLIPSGKTEGAVVWHIRPDVIPNWTRPPMVAHSQAGYAPNFPKVAVIELDPKFNAPKTAKVLRLVKTAPTSRCSKGPLSDSDPVAALHLREVRFLFRQGARPVRDRICGPAHRPVPHRQGRLQPDVAIQPDGFLAVEMDHVSVREGYRLWHGVSHLDDARQAPPNTQHFDGYRWARTSIPPTNPASTSPV
jgi:endoglucanase